MFRTVASLAFAVLAVYGAPAKRQLSISTFEGETVSNSYIVTLKSGASIDAHTSRLFSANRGSKVTHDLPLINSYAGTFSQAELDEILASEDVESVEENGIVSIFAEQTTAPWGLQSISSRTPVGASDTSALTYTYSYDEPAGEGVDIYIIDTGIFVGHSQFGGRARWGFSAGSLPSADGHGHGTHCAGTAASAAYGVSKNANLIAVKVLSDSGSGSVADIAQGIQWVVDQRAASGRPSVASMSLGGSASTALDNAVSNAINAGLPFTIAAGNSNVDAANTSPARVASAITVASSTIGNAKSSFSNFGPVVDIWAPGTEIVSTWIGSTTATNKISGTSMATPHVAGLVAYLLGKEPSLTPAQVSEKLVSLSTTGVLTGVPSGTVNRLAFNGGASGGTPPSSSSSTVAPTSASSSSVPTSSSSSTTTVNNCPWWWPDCPWKDW